MTAHSANKAAAKANPKSKSKATKATAKGAAAVETHAFQTEVQQLLHLIIHSLYSNKDIFLRELISNASDACDRLRFLALTDASLVADDALGLWIDVDEGQKTIRIRDNGIGMDRDEVIANIGTIARSGTRKFLEQMSKKDAENSTFIGQFGVGFYSAFLVAKEVTLLTRKAGTPAAAGVKWTSSGSGDYTIETINRPERGTEIILRLLPAQTEYLERYRLRTIVSQYSDHISLPIQMRADTDSADKDAKKEGDAETPQWEAINKGSALWARPKTEISAADHQAFYTALTYDPEPPAVTLHNRVEGKMEYISLFYIPAKAPFDLWDREQRHGIKLYVRRIFIAEDAKQLLPNYLRFVRGLVDSADLPLNVSREFLQQNKGIDTIRAASVKKVLAELKRIQTKEPAQYASLWKEYGRVIKEGMIEDFENRDAIAKLLRFASTHAPSADAHKGTKKSTQKDSQKGNKKDAADESPDSPDDSAQSVSLDDYLTRMPAKQKAIYYVTADSHIAAKSSPHLEVFRKNNIEVLLLSDPVDEWVVGHLTHYEEKPLQSIAKGDLDMTELGAPQPSPPDRQDSLKPLVAKIQAALQDQVKEVRISNRLVDSPACLVADEHDMGGNLERILQAVGQNAPTAKPILEINPDHAIIQQIASTQQTATAQQIDVEGDLVADWASVLFDHAALAEGAGLRDPGGYVKRINKLLVK